MQQSSVHYNMVTLRNWLIALIAVYISGANRCWAVPVREDILLRQEDGKQQVFSIYKRMFNKQVSLSKTESSYTKLFVAIGATAESFGEGEPELLDDVEIVDLIELDHPCIKPAPFPVPMSGAVGAYVDGAPTICGGMYEDGSDHCYRVRVICVHSCAYDITQ